MSLIRVTDKRETERAVAKIRAAFREHGELVRKTLGFPGGAVRQALWKVEDAGIWFSYDTEPNRHWCTFGTLPMGTSSKIPITVEINPPKKGLNRRIAGVLAIDGAKRLQLCHTGRVGGGRKGIGKAEFVKWNSSERVAITDPDGRTTQAYRVAEIGHLRMIHQIAEFVRSVADFKEDKPPLIKYYEKAPFGGADEEREGTRHVPARGATTARSDHAIVRNRLAELIEATGRSTARDQQRDLIVGKPAKPQFQFEIKTGHELQSLYTAVGQLLMHNVVNPAGTRVVVLPDGLHSERRNALGALKIKLVTYRWTTTSLVFTGLDQLFPGIRKAAPLTKADAR